MSSSSSSFYLTNKRVNLDFFAENTSSDGGTDDPTYGNQQGSLFPGYYWQYMLNELLYIDGETGQVILPVLRPGNVHSNKWNHRFLRIMVQALRSRFPNLQIIIRADAGFSCPDFYELVQEMDLDFCVGVASNERLKKVIEPLYQEIDKEYAQQNIRFKTFMGPFSYQADSWPCPQDLYAKIESTGKGMNVRLIVSKKSLKWLKGKIKFITRKTIPCSFDERILR